MLVVDVVLVLDPLLQLSVLADLVRCDPGAHVYKLLPQLRVGVEDLAGGNDGAENTAHNLVVHSRAHHQPALLGRVAGAGNQPAVGGMLDQ